MTPFCRWLKLSVNRATVMTTLWLAAALPALSATPTTPASHNSNSSRGNGELIINYTPVEDPADQRLNYPLAVIKLALEKTRLQYGNFQITHIPQFLSVARAIYELKRDTWPNYFFPGGVNIEILGRENLEPVDFPIDQGLLSYRICFVSPQAKERVAAVKSLTELRQFIIAQGTNWPDVTILRHNGFTVQEVGTYPGLFKMVISGRADLLCRGISELKQEYTEFKYLGNLQYDETFVLTYPMRYSIYFNKNSREAVRRIETGLKIAQQDGSLHQLFLKHFRDDIVFARLGKRRFFNLQTPYDDNFSDNYKSYLIDPLLIK